MTTEPQPPILITFDGEARSGKGTIVQTTKDYIRTTLKRSVMLIDAGQIFRVLVVAARRANINLDNPDEIDRFLSNDESVEKCMQLVRDVYHMQKDERDSLLYTNEVGHNSAKIGARPLSQSFKDNLLKQWLRNARNESYEIVLLDGRALEEVGTELEKEGLCDFRLGLYFICEPLMGARRTLGFANKPYDTLNIDEKNSIDELILQIKTRNEADEKRAVQPLVRPAGVEISRLPDINPNTTSGRPMYLIDTSREMTKEEMSLPVIKLIEGYLN